MLKPSNRMLLPTANMILRGPGAARRRSNPAKREGGERLGFRKRHLKVLAADIVKKDVDLVRSRSKQGSVRLVAL
jgi:hypothetical protein